MKDELFTIAIVGRPNVGKSSLINALLGFRRAIVLDMPGTTMDEVAERVNWGPKPLLLVDSQGIFDEKDSTVLKRLMERADAFIFVVDAISGLTPFDQWIASELHQARKPVLLVVNKTEKPDSETALDFAELGFPEIEEVSAAHRRNLSGIREWSLQRSGQPAVAPVIVEEDEQEFVEELSREEVEAAEEAAALEARDNEPLSLALVGRPNTGKSTLMNLLCNTHVSRVSPLPLTTRDPVKFELETPRGRVRLIDTAGMRRPRSKKEALEVFSIQASTRAIRRADVVFLCLASHESITDQDMRLLNLLVREGKPAAILMNFWDQLSAKERKDFVENSEFSGYLKQFHTIPVSGLTGWNTHKCLPTAFRLFAHSKRRVKTSALNRLVDSIISKNPPPTRGRQSFNILYASQVKVEPPTFVFFMNRKEALPSSYQKYLEHRLRDALGFRGQTIRVFFRGGDRDSR